MSDTYVTLHGWVGGDVTYRHPQGTSVANFRLASTPRLKKEGEWVDGDTTWYSVTVWRHLAENIRDSVRKGDAVIVHGRLRTDTWKREDGETNSTLQIDASLVGHDLSRGTSEFVRTPRPERTGSEADREAEALARAIPDDLPDQVDGWGNPVVPADPGPGVAAVGSGTSRDVDAA